MKTIALLLLALLLNGCVSVVDTTIVHIKSEKVKIDLAVGVPEIYEVVE